MTGPDLDAKDTWGRKQTHVPSVQPMLECLNSSPCRVGFGESLHNLNYSSQMSSPLVFPNSPGRMQKWGRKNSSVFCVLTGSFSCSHCAQFYSVRVRLFATPWTTARQPSLSIANSQSLLMFMSIESVMPSNHLILCRPLLLPPSICPSIRVFSNELALYLRWPKYWSFSFSISPSNEYSGLISFRRDLLDLFAVQGL